TTLPPKRTGMTTRVMTNVLVRTTAKYSRTATTSILRMELILCRVVRLSDADEDVVQGRLTYLEVAHSTALHEIAQKGLSVRLRREAQFLPAAKVRNLNNAG